MVSLVGTVAAVGLLAGQTTPLSSQKQRITKSDHSQGASSQNDPNASKGPTQNPMPPSSGPASNRAQDNSSEKSDELSIQRNVELFTGILAFVGVIQSAVLVFTWLAIRRQTDLQKFLTRQWLDVENWSIDRESPREGARETEMGYVPERLRDFMSLAIRFDILNRTTYPISFDGLTVSIGKPDHKTWRWEQFEFRSPTIIPPYLSNKDRSEGFFVPLTLEEEDGVLRYTKNNLHMQVRVQMYFLDSDGKRQMQQVSGWVKYGETEFMFHKEGGWNEVEKKTVQETTQHDSQKPN